MEDIPCSRVGHIYRKYVPYKVPAGVSLARVRWWLSRGQRRGVGRQGLAPGPLGSRSWVVPRVKSYPLLSRCNSLEEQIFKTKLLNS